MHGGGKHADDLSYDCGMRPCVCRAQDDVCPLAEFRDGTEKNCWISSGGSGGIGSHREGHIDSRILSRACYSVTIAIDQLSPIHSPAPNGGRGDPPAGRRASIEWSVLSGESGGTPQNDPVHQRWHQSTDVALLKTRAPFHPFPRGSQRIGSARPYFMPF